MIYELLTTVSSFIVNVISSLGYGGVGILMTLESACIPIPSEIIMPFSGYLVFSGIFSLWPVIFWGTIGNLIGSVIAYLVGFYGGRPLIERYGKYILVSRHDLEQAQRWFGKYGSLSIFFSRMLPVVRTFISLPAGIARMPFWKFSLYTLAGSLPWVFVLTYVGILTGENWSKIEIYFRKFDWLIIILIVGLLGWWIWKKLSKKT
jgi:membrane protein DedA with SNARE-associated domain